MPPKVEKKSPGNWISRALIMLGRLFLDRYKDVAEGVCGVNLAVFGRKLDRQGVFIVDRGFHDVAVVVDETLKRRDEVVDIIQDSLIRCAVF